MRARLAVRWFATALVDLAYRLAQTLASLLGGWRRAMWRKATGWVQVSPPERSFNFFDVFLIDDVRGYAVGRQGILFRTADGGATWTEVAHGQTTQDLHAVCFADASVGYLVGDAGTVLRTDDGGTSWTLQTTPRGVAVDFRDVAVLDQQRAIIVGLEIEPRRSSDLMFDYHPGVILVTDDAGSSWARPDALPEEVRALYAVDMVDANTGLAAGGEDIVQYGCYFPRAALLRTNDGGRTWAQEMPSVEDRRPWNDVGLYDSSRAVALTSASPPSYTHDGSMWLPSSYVECYGRCTVVEQMAVAFLDAQSVVYVGNGMAAGILKSIDGGQQWRTVDDTTYPSLMGLSFPGSSRGVAVGLHSTVIQTDDAGETWRPSETFSPEPFSGEDLMAVHFADAQTGYAVTWKGTVARTHDSGASWQRIRNAQASLQAVRFLDAQSGFIGGSGLFRTTDGCATLTALLSSDSGETYSEQSCGSYLPVDSLDFGEANIGVLVGRQGIYRTSDGGLLWKRVALSFGIADLLFHGVKLAEATQVIAVATRAGWGGTILRSTDAGVSWQRIDLPAPLQWGPDDLHVLDLRAVHFPAGQNRVGYAVGCTGAVIRTDDGGQSWRNLRLDVGTGEHWCFGHWYGVFFVTPETGWIVGTAPEQSVDQGVILHTVDGGGSWERQETPTPASFKGRKLRDIGFVSPAVGTAVGSDGLVVWTGSAGG